MFRVITNIRITSNVHHLLGIPDAKETIGDDLRKFIISSMIKNAGGQFIDVSIGWALDHRYYGNRIQSDTCFHVHPTHPSGMRSWTRLLAMKQIPEELKKAVKNYQVDNPSCYGNFDGVFVILDKQTDSAMKGS